jgi:cytochrome P450
MQRLRIRDREYVIPSHTTVTLNFAALHTHPQYWGDDALEFRPDRWIVPEEQRTPDSPLFQPVPGSFVPWNMGPRICPGKKFSQVEFVRVIVGLFANGTKVELATLEGEGGQEAKKRALQVVNEAKLEVTLKMVDAERIGLRWSRRT